MPTAPPASPASPARRLILASASPRRRAFLESLGLSCEVRPADADETPQPDERPEAYVARVAALKARLVAQQAGDDAVVLAADTVVTLDGAILGKPVDGVDFAAMMRRLSGRTHQVSTAVTVQRGALQESDRVDTAVTFRALTAREIDWYWATGEPRDKAGGYALQGVGGAFVARIDGSHSGVIGLPLTETLQLLARAGIAPPWGA